MVIHFSISLSIILHILLFTLSIICHDFTIHFIGRFHSRALYHAVYHIGAFADAFAAIFIIAAASRHFRASLLYNSSTSRRALSFSLIRAYQAGSTIIFILFVMLRCRHLLKAIYFAAAADASSRSNMPRYDKLQRRGSIRASISMPHSPPLRQLPHYWLTLTAGWLHFSAPRRFSLSRRRTCYYFILRGKARRLYNAESQF